jgi:hypothetical protein
LLPNDASSVIVKADIVTSDATRQLPNRSVD